MEGAGSGEHNRRGSNLRKALLPGGCGLKNDAPRSPVHLQTSKSHVWSLWKYSQYGRLKACATQVGIIAARLVFNFEDLENLWALLSP